MFHKMKRKRSFAVAFATMSSLLLLLTAYQNCGGSLTALNSAKSTSSSLCEEDCPSVGGGNETPNTSGNNDGTGSNNDPLVNPDDSPAPEDGDVSTGPPDDSGAVAPPGDDTKPPSANQWIQVPKRTKAQKTAGLAGGEGWQQTVSMAYAPSNPNIAYLVSDTNQVWKSTDGGTSWQRKANGFFANGGVSLAIDSTNPNIVYVAGSKMEDTVNANLHVAEGIFRTTDGGDNWTRVANVHFHRHMGGIHFAFAGSSIYAAPSEGGLLKSTNGTTWNLLSKSGGGYVLDAHSGLYDIKVHPTDNTILFVSTGLGLYKVVDNGGSATVTKIGTSWSSPYRSPTATVFATVINHNDPSIVFATAGTSGVYKSTDGGLTFTQTKASPVSNGKTGKAKQIGMSPVNPDKIMVGFTGLWPTKQLYYTHNGGTNWYLTQTMDEKMTGPEFEGENALSPWVCGSLFSGGWTEDFSGSHESNAPVAFHPTIEDTALMAGHAAIVRKTIDGGEYWKYSNTGYTGSGGLYESPCLFAWDGADPNKLATFHSDFGGMLTENGEDTFKSIATSNPEAASGGALNGDIIVISNGNWTNPNDYKAAVSRDNGDSFTGISGTAGTKDDWAYCLVSFHPQNDNIVYAGKYRFDNIGTSNAYVTTGNSRNIHAVWQGNGDYVYSYSGNTIYKSTNKGATWSASTYYPSLNLPSGQAVKQIVIDPTDQNRIYAAVNAGGVYIITNTADNGGEVVYRGDANGITKSRYGTEDINSVAVDPNNPNVVYAAAYASWKGHSNGVFRSTDYGMTWTNINGNLGADMNIKGISVNPHNSYVYIASHAGTWKLPPPPSTTTAER